ncbi:acyl-CoA thioesterase [Pseudotabrizicola alkalilacus]|uniref:Acyl-CoA thioesterase n=1 Tax=Pseudotabrizicola alkalilacus TaxID=2305252 RepID=A0A411Z569_9RHOB|nr:acyl-CoA thioesterase [Pseudotabrizicola alkalilacus]RGP38194.1 acyl-CoA thioesterase [Pseudotabrizicola alkalilacus]
MSREDQPPEGSPTIRTIAMPADTNPSGDIFGGWLMSQMDLAAGSVAALTSGGRSATIAVDAMIFHRPVKVGDEVSLYASLVRLGRTSMTIHVDAWRRPREIARTEKVTEANFTFVALDSEGRPIPIRPNVEMPQRQST